MDYIKKFEELSEKIDKTNLEINDLEKLYPNRPTKPFFNLAKPDIYYNKKPVFFDSKILFFLLIIFIVSTFVILLIFGQSSLFVSVIILGVIAIIFLTLIYSNKMNAYKIQETKDQKVIKKYNLEKNKYESQLNSYKQDLEKYNLTVKKISANSNLTLLRRKRDNLLLQIQPIISNLKLPNNITDKERFNLVMKMGRYTKKYRPNNPLIEHRLSDDEIERITKSYLNDQNKVKRDNIDKATNYLNELSSDRLHYIIGLLLKVEKIQKSQLPQNEKTSQIKYILWTQHNASKKIWIGAIIGTLFGLLFFGTGGIGIAAFGGAFGIWGFLAGTTGGVLVSSLIQNFENTKNK